jgi:hypothetical protein
MSEFLCDFCPKGFATKRGLKAHQRHGKCAQKLEASLGVAVGEATGAADLFPHAPTADDEEDEDDATSPLASPLASKKRAARASFEKPTNDKMQRLLEEEDEDERPTPRKMFEEEDTKMPAQVDDAGAFDPVEEPFDDNSVNHDEFMERHGLKLRHEPPSAEEMWEAKFDEPPEDVTRQLFKDYCAHAKEHFAPLDQDQEAAVRLFDILRKKKAPLDTYDDIMTWHLRDKGSLLPGETVGQSGTFIGRKALMSFLKKRYNMEDKFPEMKHICLPHSHAQVSVVCHLASACVESLLTDPRLTDEDLSFYNNNPLANPPEKVEHVGDLNTGYAFISGHRKYKTKPNQVPIGIQWYIDGAVTGQFENLQIVALKMTLSCFTHKYRMKEHAWRTLGYVVHYSKAKSRGKKIFVESKHMDANVMAHRMNGEEGQFSEKDRVEEHAQDFHAQLQTILSNFLEVQERGIMWDLPYRGRLYKDLHLVFFSIMVKCDTDEAELLVGKYRSRGKHVKNLCRYCTCPTADTDNPLANYPHKTVPMIKKLVADNDLKGLNDISQHNIHNAWHKIRFSPVNDQGIHGACPSEMLHALLLGLFKYLRQIFFTHIGPTTDMALEIDGLASQYGELFCRQSERDLPKCKFGEGILKGGKLMAKEYRGVLLVIAAVLRSTKGREMLRTKKNFAKDFLLNDWLLLVETLLEWEAYLCEPRMEVRHVKRLVKKHRFIMHLFLRVARREKGMGMKIMKFHAVVHMAIDILLFGVPMEHDTGANESHHKPTKVAAGLTQKKPSSFEFQTAIRMSEFAVIELAMEELCGRKQWRYYEGFEEPSEEHTTHAPPTTGEELPDADGYATSDTESSTDSDKMEAEPGIFVTKGTQILVVEDENGDAAMAVKSRMKDPEDILWDQCVLDFLDELQELVSDFIESLTIRTEHHRNGQIFRSHPEYRQEGKWRDWVMVDWGEDGQQPAEIWCFVVLEGIDEGAGLHFGGVDLTDGTYAVVESASLSTNEKQRSMSDIFVPYEKEVASHKNGVVTGRNLYLADVNAFVSPLCMIPDIGGKTGNKYFQVKPRSAWVSEFVAWLEDPHENDDMTD